MAQAVRQYSMEQIAQFCVDAGYKRWFVVTAVCVIWAESRGNAWAIGLNSSNQDSPAYLSLDLGLVQWNTHFHPEMTTQQAFSPEWAIAKMFQLTNGGNKNMSLWHSYSSGAYKAFASPAANAARAIGVQL